MKTCRFLASLIIVIMVFSLNKAYAYDPSFSNWNRLESGELEQMRGGFFTTIGGIGINIDWLVQVDVNDSNVLSHQVTDDFTGKIVSIDDFGDVSVSDFQTMGLFLQNSSDNIQVQAKQFVDLQITNIEFYKSDRFTSQLTYGIVDGLW